MDHLEINPYTPGHVCMEVNSKNSEKSIMKNLFNYFNKKQQKMNNSFNKIMNSQNQENKQQRLTIYAPMLEGLVTCKREALSSADCPSRKNFIQQNKNFVVKKARPMTTNPTKKQSNEQSQKIQKKSFKNKFLFQELPNIEVGVKANISHVSSNQNGQITQLNISNIRSEGLSQYSKELPNIELLRQKTPQGQEKEDTSKNNIKKSVQNSVLIQGLNTSFEHFQSRKSSLNRKILFCNNNNNNNNQHNNDTSNNFSYNKINNQNNQTLLTQGALETQANTTIQNIGEQSKNAYSYTINSNIDNTQQFSQMMNQTCTDQQTLDPQKQIKTISDNCKTEDSEAVCLQNRFDNAAKANENYHSQNNHFCSKSTNNMHSISTQNNEYIHNQKNGEQTTLDTLIQANLISGNEQQQQIQIGVEKLSNLVQQQQQLTEVNDLSLDKQLIDASYRNLLNERPPFQVKIKGPRNRVRSSCGFTDGRSFSKEFSKQTNKLNSSFNEISELKNEILKGGQVGKVSYNHSTKSSSNKIQPVLNNNPNFNIHVRNKSESDSQRNFSREKSELQGYNNSHSDDRLDDFLSNQQTLREIHNIKDSLPIKTEFLTYDSMGKRESEGVFQVTIEEDIQNIVTLEENDAERQNEQQLQIEQLPTNRLGDLEIRVDNQNQNNERTTNHTPQKMMMMGTNLSSLQNSVHQMQMRSNHITFNVMSNAKDFVDQQASFLQQISDQKQFMTSSFDGRNHSSNISQNEQEMKASRHFNEMKEYIQNQIDSNKQAISQYYKISQNQSSRKSLTNKPESQLNSSLSRQVSHFAHGESNGFSQEQQQSNQQIISRPASSKIPLSSGARKLSVDRKYNFYDQLDKKLEEKKKQITNFVEPNHLQSAAQAQQKEISANDKQKSFQPTSKGFISGRNNSVQPTSNILNHKQPLSQRRKSTQDSSRINSQNLQLNESKMFNYNVVEMKEIPQKHNHQAFVLSEHNNQLYQNGNGQNTKREQQCNEISHYNKPIEQQIYYQQFLSNHPTTAAHTQETNNGFHHNKYNQIPHLQQQQQGVRRVYENKENIGNQQFNNQIKQDHQSQSFYNHNNLNNFSNNNNQIINSKQQQQLQCLQATSLQPQQNQYSESQQQVNNAQQPQQQNQRNTEAQDFGYDIPTQSRITRKKIRSSTMEDSIDGNNQKDYNNNVYSSERQSLVNSSRNGHLSSHSQLTKEQQLKVIKQVKEQSQNKMKLHSYLSQNKQVHEHMKHTSDFLQRNNSSVSQQVQNQINSTLQNCSSNNLGILCHTQQTNQMNYNSHLQSTQRKSINPLTSIQNTQEFLQSMKLINNNNQTYGEDLNQSYQQGLYNRLQSAKSSARRQNPLIQSDQSNLMKNYISPFCYTSTDQFGYTKQLAGQLNVTQQYMLCAQQQNNNNNQLNIAAIPQPTEVDTSFSRRKQSVNPLYNILQEQGHKNSIELNSNNVKFYENLNSESIKQDIDIDLDQKVYANHQYQYALKRQQRREDNYLQESQNRNILNQTAQIKSKLQQNILSNNQNRINQTNKQQKIIRNEQNPLSQSIQSHPFNQKQARQDIHSNQMQAVQSNNIQFTLGRQCRGKENIPMLDNQQYLDQYQMDDINNLQRGRQTNSKTSQRYHIQLNEEVVDDKTLEYSGSKAGVEIYY